MAKDTATSRTRNTKAIDSSRPQPTRPGQSPLAPDPQPPAATAAPLSRLHLQPTARHPRHLPCHSHRCCSMSCWKGHQSVLLLLLLLLLQTAVQPAPPPWHQLSLPAKKQSPTHWTHWVHEQPPDRSDPACCWQQRQQPCSLRGLCCRPDELVLN